MSMPSVSTAFIQTFKRDILLLARKKVEFLNPLLFGFLVVLMFPLGLDPAPAKLSMLSPGLVWIIALLSCLFATDGLFKEDFDDGSLALMLLSPQPAYFLLMARVWAHWLASGFAVALVAPLFGIMLYLPEGAYVAMVTSLVLGTVSLIFIGAIGSALTVGLKNSGVILTIIILPLYVPVLIFGVACVEAASQGMSYVAYLAILAAFMCLSVVLAPLAIQAGLSINLDAS